VITTWRSTRLLRMAHVWSWSNVQDLLPAFDGFYADSLGISLECQSTSPHGVIAAPASDVQQVRGGRGGHRGAAVSHRGAAVGHRGAVVVGHRGAVAVGRHGAVAVGRRYHGGIWYGTGRRYWHVGPWCRIMLASDRHRVRLDLRRIRLACVTTPAGFRPADVDAETLLANPGWGCMSISSTRPAIGRACRSDRRR
jgi:hypothetical protein